MKCSAQIVCLTIGFGNGTLEARPLASGPCLSSPSPSLHRQYIFSPESLPSFVFREVLGRRSDSISQPV